MYSHYYNTLSILDIQRFLKEFLFSSLIFFTITTPLTIHQLNILRVLKPEDIKKSSEVTSFLKLCDRRGDIKLLSAHNKKFVVHECTVFLIL